jgi:hypothetical protein
VETKILEALEIKTEIQIEKASNPGIDKIL